MKQKLTSIIVDDKAKELLLNCFRLFFEIVPSLNRANPIYLEHRSEYIYNYKIKSSERKFTLSLKFSPRFVIKSSNELTIPNPEFEISYELNDQRMISQIRLKDNICRSAVHHNYNSTDILRKLEDELLRRKLLHS